MNRPSFGLGRLVHVRWPKSLLLLLWHLLVGLSRGLLRI